MLKLPDTETAQIAEAIAQVKQQLCYCDVCGTITDTNPCYICTSPRRNQRLICVVEESDDLWAIERTNGYTGLYHVLGGVLSPLDGTGPDELGINKLFQRIKDSTNNAEPVQEVILATKLGRQKDRRRLSILHSIWKRLILLSLVLLTVFPSVGIWNILTK